MNKLGIFFSIFIKFNRNSHRKFAFFDILQLWNKVVASPTLYFDQKFEISNIRTIRAIIYKKKVPFFYFLLQKSTSIFFWSSWRGPPKHSDLHFLDLTPWPMGKGVLRPLHPSRRLLIHSIECWMTQQTGYSEDPYSRPSPRLPLHHFSQRRMLASLLRREARRSQGDLEALARGQRFFSLHQFTLCCCMLFTTLRCQPPPPLS